MYESNEQGNLARLTWISVAMAVAAMAAIGFTILSLRDDALRDAARDATNVASILSDQVSYSTRSVEKTIDAAVDFINSAHLTDETSFETFSRSEQTYRVLKDLNSGLPQADSITIVGPRGDFFGTTHGWPSPKINIADRTFFAFEATHDEPGVHVFTPVVSRVTNEKTLFYSKRISAPDGSLFGVVLVGVNLHYYQSVYQTLANLDNKSMALVLKSGEIIARFPSRGLHGGGRMPDNTKWWDVVQRGGGAFIGRGVYDAEPHIVAVQPVAGYPMVVDVSEKESDVLKLWRMRAVEIALGGFSALLCAMLLLRSTLSQFRRSLESEASLARKSEALAQLNDQFGIVLNNMPQGVVLYSENRRIIVANRRYADMYGLDETDVQPGVLLDEVLKKRIDKGIFLENSDFYLKKRLSEVAVISSIGPIQTIERLSDGRAILISRRPIPGGGWLAVHDDITARQQAEDRITHLAHYDQLTGAANRSVLLERMEKRFEDARRTGNSFAILLLDLDDFKGINDTYGHPVGDGLLKSFVGRINSCVREGDLVARVGGDEFAVLLSDLGEFEDAASSVGWRILQSVREPFDIDGVRIEAFSSIGAAIGPNDGPDFETLLKNADVALYRAKTEGRNRIRFFDAKMDAERHNLRALKTDLAEAIARGELEVHYQPVVKAPGRVISCMEALLRWRHSERGMVGPGIFIEVAEQSGLMGALGEFVLNTACRDAAAWPQDVKVTVNLSPTQFSNGKLVDVVRQALETSGLAPGRLVLEITESTLMENIEPNLSALHALKALGVQIALDDFGTGYSSLSYLQSFPLDIVKIDRSFVLAMQTRQHTLEIVSLIVALAQRLDIVTVAEGVETQDQLDLVLAAGCSLVQGYFFSGPRPIEQFDLRSASLDGFDRRAA